MRLRAVHWIGGVRHPRGICLSGWPCCCSGMRASRIAHRAEVCTRVPAEVTCKPCLALMRRDDHADRWGIIGADEGED